MLPYTEQEESEFKIEEPERRRKVGSSKNNQYSVISY